MNKKIIMILLAMLFIWTTNTFPADNYSSIKSFFGTINGRLRIKMNITLDGKNVTGSYYYESKLINIPLKGRIDGAKKITMNEYNAAGSVSGTFKGIIEGNKFTGNWSTLDGKKEFPFALEEIAGQADLNGSWANKNNVLDFILMLSQEGSRVTGHHSGITPDASRIDDSTGGEPSLNGTVDGNVARIIFTSAYGFDGNGDPLKGEAVIIYNGDTAVWKITKRPDGEIYFPDEMVLKKQESGQRDKR